jgi:hypothetical protein
MVSPRGAAAIAVGATTVVGGGLLYLAWQQGWLTGIGIPKPTPAATTAAGRAREGRPYPSGNDIGYIGSSIGPRSNYPAGDRARYAEVEYQPLGPEQSRPIPTGAGYTTARNKAVLDRLFH